MIYRRNSILALTLTAALAVSPFAFPSVGRTQATAIAKDATALPVGANPDFQGLWRTSGRGVRGRDGAAGGCCSEEGWHDVQAMLLPWARDIMAKRDEGLKSGVIVPTNTQECKPDGVPTVIEIPYPFQFLQSRNEVIMMYEADYQVRRIRMGGEHLKNQNPNWYGDSIGRWDDGVLEIDTVGLSKLGQTNWDGIPHTDQLHVLERYKITSPGAMELTMTLTDLGTFTGPWTIVKHFRQLKERRLLEYVCAENNRDASVPVE